MALTNLKVIQPAGAVQDNIVFDLTCNSNVSIGDIVTVQSGTVEKAQGNNYSNSLVLGICVEKVSSTVCDVMITGPTGDIYTGLDVAKQYYLSASIPGGISDTIPSGSGEYAIRIGRAYSSTGLIIQIERVVKRV